MWARLTSSGTAGGSVEGGVETKAAGEANVRKEVLALLTLLMVFALDLGQARGEPTLVQVHQDERGFKLIVDGQDFMVFGMNWSYTPIGQTYSYSLWTQPDDIIEEVLHREMPLLREMGVNAIRQYADIPPRWVEWIYRHYGIYTAVNPLMGRYGINLNGGWVPQVDYANPAHRQVILDEVRDAVERYHDVAGVLMWLLGNENNYGLHWTSFEIEDLPDEPGAHERARAAPLYSLMGEATDLIKGQDQHHPVALVNGDLQYIDLIAEHCQSMDILGSNVYRGPSARDFFDEVRRRLNRPALFAEFGSDAYNARTQEEDHLSQAEYLLEQWQEIYEHSYGHGRSGAAVGGFIFQWTDGWWKHKQEINLDVHDRTATWSNQAYLNDYVPGQNNMNEEWFGITALGPPNERGIHRVRPRSAYYALRQAFRLSPYAQDTTLEGIREHFHGIRPMDHASRYEASEALARLDLLEAVRVSRLQMRFDTAVSEGNERTERPSERIFDHTESFLMDVTLQPNPQIFGRLSLSVVGNVAANRLDPISYESRGRAWTPKAAADDEQAFDRLAIYQAEFKLDHRLFELEGFYRTGHHHWGDEGDFFGLYQNAYYGPNLDLYNGQAPFGMVFSGHRQLDGLKIAFGPELFWGANPSVVAKYRRRFGPVTLTVMHHEDIAQGSVNQLSTAAIPEPVNRRTTLHAAYAKGRFKLEIGGIFSGSQRVGDEFWWTRDTETVGLGNTGLEVLRDEIQWLDTLGAKAKLSFNLGRFRFYLQGGYRGLVADGGPDQVITVTGWSMKESGRGNQFNALGGVALTLGSFQIAPHVLFQRPLVGPLTRTDDVFVADSGEYYPGTRPRNIFDDPFAVLDNRETLGFELLLVYDPTPATWFWHWDRMNREDAPFAASIDAVYRMQPTTRDGNIIILEGGQPVPLGDVPPAHDVWDITFNFFANRGGGIRLAGAAFVGQNQSTGADPRLVTRYGANLRLAWQRLLFSTKVSLNDWGPYDYHRDFNLTYPFQWYGDLSYGWRPAVFGKLDTRIGLRSQVRLLDEYSPEYLEDSDGLGLEYEIGTYVTVSL
jgi:hypothetical protein